HLGEGEAEVELPEGATLHRVEMGDRSGESCLRASIVVAQRLLELVRGTGLDAIEFAEYEGMGSAWLALRSLNEHAASVPVAVHLHSPTELNAELNGHSLKSLPRGMRELIDAERRCLALADGVCAPGSFMADWARDRFAMSQRPEMIPYSAEIEQALRVHAEGPPTLLYVGRLEQRKGVDTLIRAWNRIGASERSWLLHLVGADTNTAPGGGSCSAWLESLLDPPLRERTKFLGVMGVEALAAHRASAAVAVIPSRWENFPNTCIEAMGSGLPVVASDHGGMAEMLGLPARGGVADGPCGSVFPVGDDEALARTLERWMRMEPAERMAAGDAARERIQQWCDPERVATRRVEWLGSLRARPGKTDELLESLLRVGPIERACALDEVLQRTLERFDSATGADGRVGDPALWVKRMRRAIGDCAKKGLSPVALYGAGHFTRSIGAALKSPPAEVVCIVDDNPAAQGQWLHGLPVVSQEDALGLGVRAAILSANQWEDRLWESSRPLRDAGVEVVRLFGGGRVPRVMVVESGIGTRHFAGVTDQLKKMGFEVIGDTAHAVYPVPEDDLDLVCVADVLAPRNIAVLRAARAKGIR
ncbi:MAG: glycosyltransferase, partial [Phycisphaerales bacterium]